VKRIGKNIAALAALFLVPLVARANDPVLTGGLALEGPTQGVCIQIQSQSPATLQGRVINVYRRDGDLSAAGTYVFCGQMRAQSDPRTIEALLRRSTRLTQDDPDYRMAEISDAVEKLFQDLGTSGSGLSLGEKLSVLIEMSETDLTLRDNLLFYAKRFPSMGVVAGTAFMEAYDVQASYELRLCPPGFDGPDDGKSVVGRVSVDPTKLYVPEAPGQPHVVRVLDGRGELNVRLRWASAEGQNEAGPLIFGYNLYRIPEKLADPDWETTAPTRAELETALGIDAGSLDTSIYRVNRLPILPPRELTEAEADTSNLDLLIAKRYAFPLLWTVLGYEDIDEPGEQQEEVNMVPSLRSRRIELEDQIKEEQSLFCYIDDNDRWFGGEAFKKGQEYFYTAAASNSFGTGGDLSLFTPVIIPSFETVPAPDNVRVENVYSYDDGGEGHQQRLALKWDALRDEKGKVREDVYYFVYRWNTPTEMLPYARQPFATGMETVMADAASYFGGEDPVPVGLVAGPADLDEPNSRGVMTFFDSTITGEYEGVTFYYTVRAAVPNGSTAPFYPLFSPHSAPAWGVLRDREGPAPATGLTISIPCSSVDVNHEGPVIHEIIDDDGYRLSPGRHLLNLTCFADNDPEEALKLKTAYFRYSDNGIIRSLGSVNFEGGADISFTHEIEMKDTFIVSCQVELTNGKLSNWEECEVNLEKVETSQLINVLFFTSVTSGMTTVGDGCSVYHPLDPVGHPTLEFYPGGGTFGYELERVVDGQFPELLDTEEQPDDGESFSTDTGIIYVDFDIPVVAGNICYYLRTYDENGNPGPRQVFGCFQLTGGGVELPVPTLTKVSGENTPEKPQMSVTWFCPPSGVERFAILISPAAEDVDIATPAGGALVGPIESPAQTTITEGEAEVERVYNRYATVRTSAFIEGGDLSASEPAVVESGLFTALITSGIEVGVQYNVRVQALGPTFESDEGPLNLASNPSEMISFEWVEPRRVVVGEQGPNVNWPERAISNAAPCPVASVCPELIDTLGHGSWEHLAAVGIRIGHFPPKAGIECRDGGEAGGPKQAPLFSMNFPFDLEAEIFYDLDERGQSFGDIFPCLIYRMEVEPGSGVGDYYDTEQPFSGDLIQCSPVISTESIAYDTNAGGANFRDPFMFIGPLVQDASSYYPFYILDTQPVIKGSTYRYFLAHLKEGGEVEHFWNLGTIEIPE